MATSNFYVYDTVLTIYIIALPWVILGPLEIF